MAKHRGFMPTENYKSISIRKDLLKEVKEIVKMKPKGYKYETTSGFINDAINHHIRRVRQSIKTENFPDQFFEAFNLKK